LVYKIERINTMELIKFNNKDYDIDDIKTSKNLNRMQADEIKHLDTLAQSYLDILNSRKVLNNA
tara:strand:- start:1629 stop:1820 length:192 start_codon:yes stop_codon:yes gene_type:complete